MFDSMKHWVAIGGVATGVGAEACAAAWVCIFNAVAAASGSFKSVP